MTTLNGCTAIITGASQGLGKVLVSTFLGAGANVVMCARDATLLEATEKELRSFCKNGQSLSSMAADVSKVNEVEALVDFALKQHRHIDVLVNNAAVTGPKGYLEEVDWTEWTQAIEINLYGPVLMCRALLPHFKANRHGKIINLSGGGATSPMPRMSAYAATKAAIVRLTETIAHETLGWGIDINAVAPGALNTRMLDDVLTAGPARVGAEHYNRALKQQQEGGASLERAAELCLFLASEESNGITGRLVSAVWDPWEKLPQLIGKLKCSEIYTLRRIVPQDRGENWENQ